MSTEFAKLFGDLNYLLGTTTWNTPLLNKIVGIMTRPEGDSTKPTIVAELIDQGLPHFGHTIKKQGMFMIGAADDNWLIEQGLTEDHIERVNQLLRKRKPELEALRDQYLK